MVPAGMLIEYFRRLVISHLAGGTYSYGMGHRDIIETDFPGVYRAQMTPQKALIPPSNQRPINSRGDFS